MADNCITTGLKKIRELFISDKRFLVVQGGMRSAKSYSILMLIISWCQTNRDKIATVVSMSYPHLSRGVIRDFQTIMKNAGIWSPNRWNSSSKIYTFENEAVLEFISVDRMSAHGPARDLLFVNEANDMAQDTFEQLAARTTGKIIIDYNPTHEFWAHTWLLKEYEDKADFIILTYLDNEALAPSIREYIESKKPKPGEEPSNFWLVYGLGQIGSLEGNVYSSWIAEQSRPEGFVLKRYGVDFGFSNDPTAVVAIYENEDKELFVETKIYEKGLLTPELVEKMKQLEPALAVCDNARPEIIAEMKRSGLRAIGCDKTAGEKMNGKRYNIELVQRRIVHFLNSDEALKKEYLSYAWRKKRSTGEWIDEPEDGNDHDMDALAYAVRDMARHRIEF